MIGAAPAHVLYFMPVYRTIWNGTAAISTAAATATATSVRETGARAERGTSVGVTAVGVKTAAAEQEEQKQEPMPLWKRQRGNLQGSNSNNYNGYESTIQAVVQPISLFDNVADDYELLEVEEGTAVIVYLLSTGW